MINFLKKLRLLSILLLVSNISLANIDRQPKQPTSTMIGPLVWSSLNSPINSYIGTDDKIHLGWVVFLTNTSRFDVNINAITLFNADYLPLKNISNININETGVNIPNVYLRHLGGISSDSGSDFSQHIPAGQSGIAYFNVINHTAEKMPSIIKLGVSMSFLDNKQKKQTLTVIDNGIQVNTDFADSVSPPLRGNNWLVANGAGSIISPHRLTTQASNGTLHSPEQFAIDFIQLKKISHHNIETGNDYTAVTGDPALLKSWLGYGAPVYSATAGRVVTVVDTLPDQLPVGTIQGMRIDKPEDFAGNRVIIKTKQDHYVLYAHLMPHSISVHVGQQISSGEQIGRLGNSGNSDAPHLHFQLMDNQSVLNTTGIPFVFHQFTLQGRFLGSLNKTLEQLIDNPKGNSITRENTEKRQDQMPLTLDLLDFR